MSSAQETENRSQPALVSIDEKINPAASIEYWNSVPATANGMLDMLGRYPWYTRIDLRASKFFLAKMQRLVPGCTTEGRLGRGVDCGAGIGRVIEGFLGRCL